MGDLDETIDTNGDTPTSDTPAGDPAAGAQTRGTDVGAVRVTGPPPKVVVAVTPTPPPPAPPDPGAPVLGICLSGGGSRALTGALGALSGLRSLPDPDDPERSVMDRVRYISSVSGGSWASVAYTFLPTEVDGSPIDDDEFLLTPVDPADLRKAGGDTSAANVEHIDPRSLGTAPQRFAPRSIARVLFKYWRWGMFRGNAKWNWFWIAAVGELILAPFGLYDARYVRRSKVTLPARFFARSRADFDARIAPSNPDLDADHFHFVERDRPHLVVNFNLLQDERIVDPVQIPVQATPDEVGALGRSPDGKLVGSGSIQTFGFGGELAGAGPQPGTAEVRIDRRYSLSDIAGCSSAFFAEQIVQFLDKEFDKVEADIVGACRDLHLPGVVGRWIARFLHSRIEPILNADASDLIPRYPYWPLGELDATDPSTEEFGFSDGGSFEDTGVLGMMARTDANRLIVFVNGAAPLSRDDETGEIKVDGQHYVHDGDDVRLEGQIATLFGYTFDNEQQRYVRYADTNPRRFAQVFDDEGPDRTSRFEELQHGLLHASTGDGTQPLGTNTVAFVQQLTTIDNPVSTVAGGRDVTVLWIVNNRVNAWQDQITDPALLADLAAGQKGQNPDGTPKPHAKGEGPLENFPLYTTGPQIHLVPEAVNMMAQLSAWNVRQQRDAITALLAR